MAISDKVVIRADDLVSWFDESVKWSWGLKGHDDTSSSIKQDNNNYSTEHNDDDRPKPVRSLKRSQVDFSEVESEKGTI